MAFERPVPEFYVLWHPDCPLGATLATRIYEWLRPGDGLGPHVFYRSLPEPHEVGARLPRALPGEPRGKVAIPATSKLQVVLLLIDANMIADAAWRAWLGALAASPARVCIPIALDGTAYNAPAPLSEQNFVRPTGLGAAADEDTVVRSLLKQLTEMLCRLLLGRGHRRDLIDHDEGEAPKIKVFLSHAKADGTGPAQRIRDHIYARTQIAAFYDENDIPFGSVFARVLDRNIAGDQTVALIAVRSASYADRPWCRREVSRFRRPFHWPRTVAPVRADRWSLPPVLVVDALDGTRATRGVPELGNAPMIRWDEAVRDQAEQVVTMVLRDALLASYHDAVAATIADRPDRVLLNWVPDPTTLLHVTAAYPARQPLEIVYPGRGLSGLELEILDELFPHVVFRSFEELPS